MYLYYENKNCFILIEGNRREAFNLYVKQGTESFVLKSKLVWIEVILLYLYSFKQKMNTKSTD